MLLVFFGNVVGLNDLIKVLFKVNTRPKFSGFIDLNAIAFTNFKTSKCNQMLV